MIRSARYAAIVALLFAGAAQAHAQVRGQSAEQRMQRPPAAQDDGSEEIVVTARRSGVPMWEIASPKGTLILVGEIDEVPKSTPWRPDRLEEATRRANRVILGIQSKASVGDLFRLFLKGGALMNLPRGTSAEDYLNRVQLRRLQDLEEQFGTDYSRKSFLLTSQDILTKQLGLGQDTTYNASEVVRTAAKRARIVARPVGSVRARVAIDDLLRASPESHIPCLNAAMDAAESGDDSVGERGRAWTRGDIPSLMSNKVEVAIGRCWPWNSDELSAEVRQQWQGALSEAASAPGVTLAVVPIRVLAERGGLLDGFERRGAQIKGPAWRRGR